MKESQIKTGIMNYLQILENIGQVYVVNTSSGAIKTIEGRYFKSGKKGHPDITVLINSKYVGLEVKTAKGRQQKNQKEAEKKINKLGGYYYIVRNVQDVIDIVKLIAFLD